MSKAKSVYDAFSGIKDEYINDAMEQKAPKKSSNLRFIIEAVACAVIVCGFVVLSLVLRSVSGPGIQGASSDETSQTESTEQTTVSDPVAVMTDKEHTTETDSLPDSETTDNGTVTDQVLEYDILGIFDMLKIKPFDVLLPTVYNGHLDYISHTLNRLDGEENENSPVFYEGVLRYDIAKAYDAVPDELKDKVTETFPPLDPSHDYPTLTIRVYNKENAENLRHIDLQEKRDYDYKYVNGGDPFDSDIDKVVFMPEQLWLGVIKSRMTKKGFHIYIECGEYIVEYKYTWDDRVDVTPLEPIENNLYFMITSSKYISSRIDKSKYEEDPSPVREIRHKILELDSILDVIRKRPYQNYYLSIEKAITALQNNPDGYIEASPYLQYDYLVHGTEKALSDYIRDTDVVEYVRVSARYKAVFYYKVMPDGQTYYSLIYKQSSGGAAFDDLTVENVCSNLVSQKEFEKNTGIKINFKYDRELIDKYLDIIYSHPGTTNTTYRIGDTSLENCDKKAQKHLAELGIEEYHYAYTKYGVYDTERQLRTANTSYIMYRMRSYPMENELHSNDNKSTLTNIMMRGEELKICGISSESSFNEFEEVFSSLGFEVTRSGLNITASACEGGLMIKLVQQYESNGETYPAKMYFSLQTISRSTVMY